MSKRSALRSSRQRDRPRESRMPTGSLGRDDGDGLRHGGGIMRHTAGVAKQTEARRGVARRGRNLRAMAGGLNPAGTHSRRGGIARHLPSELPALPDRWPSSTRSSANRNRRAAPSCWSNRTSLRRLPLATASSRWNAAAWRSKDGPASKPTATGCYRSLRSSTPSSSPLRAWHASAQARPNRLARRKLRHDHRCPAHVFPSGACAIRKNPGRITARPDRDAL